MSTTIFKTRWVQGKKSKKNKSFIINPRTAIQKQDGVRKLRAAIQELSYGTTKDDIEKQLAHANKQWMKTFYSRLK